MNTTNTGRILIIEPAIKTGQSVEYIPCIADNPSGIVILEIEFINISGLIKSFQVPIKINTPNVAKAGFDKGRKMRQNIPKGVQPSIRAASSSSFGIVKKNCLIKKVPKAETKLGIMRE